MEKDVSDKSMFLEDEYNVICFKREWLKRDGKNICGCTKCQEERDKKVDNE